MKPKVVIIGIADWAGSGYNVCCAINNVGEFDCRHISTYDHIYEFKRDILVRIYPRLRKDSYHEKILRDAVNSSGYAEAAKVLDEADIIHIWNSFPGEQSMQSSSLADNGLPINWQKVKVATMTGTTYRKYHKEINSVFGQWPKLRLTVQDALFYFPDEIEATYIPHAVDTDFFVPLEERDKVIGVYDTLYKPGARTSKSDILKVGDVLKDYPDWKIDFNYKMPWLERVEKLRRSSIFVQDISPYIGIWGRSTLEACVLGIPTFQNYSPAVLDRAGDKLGDIPLINADDTTIATELKNLIEDEGQRKEIGKKSRQWVEDHFAYPVIGKMYSQVYHEVMNEI